MTLSRVFTGLLITIVVIALACAAVIASAPVVARKLTEHYLAQAGVDATIGNVDINLFTGALAYDDIHGASEAGDGFEIGHLAVNIDYPPLLSKQIVVTRLAIDNARIDVRRTTDNGLRVGGIPVLSPDSQSSGSMNWGLALQQLAIGALSVHYTQPATGDTPAVEQTLVLNESSASDVVTWDQDNDVPVDADMSIGDSRIRVRGRVTPFGSRITANLQVQTEKFALDLLSPITDRSGLESLTGTVDADQQIKAEYAPDSGLDIAVKGRATWLDSRLVMANGPRLSSKRFDWSGRFDMQLLQPGGDSPASVRPDNSPGQRSTDAAPPPSADDGSLRMDGALPLVRLLQIAGRRDIVPIGDNKDDPDGDTVKLNGPGFAMNATIRADDLQIGRPGGLTLRQSHLEWKGQSSLSLTGPATTIQTDSRLDTRGTELIAANGTTVTADSLGWSGSTSTDVADTFIITGQGKLNLGGLGIDVPGGLESRMAGLDFDGQTRVTSGEGAVQIHTQGDIASNQLRTTVPDALELNADRLAFTGATDTDVGTDSTDIDTDGSLSAQAFVFDISRTAAFQAGDISWDGDTEVSVGTLFSRQANGRLIAGDARLDLADTDVALTADRMTYQGSYGETPGNAGEALVLTMQGAIDGHDFDVMNTAIDMPWVSLLQVHGDGLSINGLETIDMDALKASGIGLLGDSRSNIAVVEAVTASARNFQLRDLLHYRFEELDLEGTNIHVRRDPDGMGAISKFMSGGKRASASAGSGEAAGPSSSYAFDTLDISGPAIAFVDTAVEPTVRIDGADLNLAVEGLDTATPNQNASFRLAVDLGAYGHLDGRGDIAPMASNGVNMDIDAWLRSLAMTPLSGYLNAALGRKIANGAIDGTLKMKATDGQLDGNLDTTLSNFRLAPTPHEQTNVALGVSLDTALALIRGQSDTINFQTLILGDVTSPYFSVKNLVREAVLAGLRTAILSDYSPVGLLNRAKNAVMNIGRSLVSRPAEFRPGRHYIRPEDREYLGRIAQAMNSKPDIRLTVTGHAVPEDADQMSFFHGASVDEDNHVSLQELARKRGEAVRDYLAARDVNPDHITLAEPVVDRNSEAKPEAVFSISR